MSSVKLINLFYKLLLPYYSPNNGPNNGPNDEPNDEPNMEPKGLLSKSRIPNMFPKGQDEEFAARSIAVCGEIN